MFAGMMIGAVGWGTCECPHLFWASAQELTSLGSDLMGRSTAFNATLFFTSIFGIAASFATTFPMLCVALFFLGSAVGVRDALISGCCLHRSRYRRGLCQQMAHFF